MLCCSHIHEAQPPGGSADATEAPGRAVDDMDPTQFDEVDPIENSHVVRLTSWTESFFGAWLAPAPPTARVLSAEAETAMESA